MEAEFSEEEFDTFKLKNLTYDSCILVGKTFFKPVEWEQPVLMRVPFQNEIKKKGMLLCLNVYERTSGFMCHLVNKMNAPP
jgi:hypothetical protein